LCSKGGVFTNNSFGGKADYDETDTIIEHDNTTTSISLGQDAEDEKYPRHVYCFIVDILDYEESDALDIDSKE